MLADAPSDLARYFDYEAFARTCFCKATLKTNGMFLLVTKFTRRDKLEIAVI